MKRFYCLKNFAVSILALSIMAYGGQFQSDSNTVALYHFNEGSGAVLHDSSGNVNNGAINNCTWSVVGHKSALSFNGTNSYVTLGSYLSKGASAWDASSTGFTLEAVVYVDSMALAMPSGNILYINDQNGEMDLYSGSGLVGASAKRVTSGWHSHTIPYAVFPSLIYLAYSWDATTKMEYFYVNGVKSDSVLVADGLNVASGGYPPMLGRYGGSATSFFSGQLSDVRVSSIARSQSSISSFWQAAIAAPALVSPTDNATSVALIPTLKWSTATYATGYGVQLSINSSFSPTIINSIVSSDSFTVALNVGTTYYWRVEGTCGRMVGPWAMDSFTTARVAPLAPTLVNPVNGAANVALSTTLTWYPVAGATAYRVQLSNSPSFTFITDTTVTGAASPISGLSTFSTYYWRVNVSNAYGTSSWSAVDSFTTIGTAPAVPVPLYPANGSTTAPRNPTLTWNPCAHATTYEVQVSPNSSFSLVNDTIVGATARKLSPPLSANTIYYWRVNAGNAYGTSVWSTVWSFTTNAAGILGGKLNYTGATMGYSGILAVYSVDGRRVMQIQFDASAIKEHLLKDAVKSLAKGVYTYRFDNNGKIENEANILVQ